ncbi:MAG: CehA/McbA family metallohydrolase, partial [Isosphaeraceae bacterium]
MLLLGIGAGMGQAETLPAETLPIVTDVEFQPLSAQVRRVVEALDNLGQPLPKTEREKIDRAINGADEKAAVRMIQEVLDRHCLIGVNINPESRVKAAQGPAAPQLVQNGWTVFLVKVQNEAGVTAELQATSPNAAPIYKQSTSSAEPRKTIHPAEIIQRWTDLAMFRDRPLKRELAGLALEYRIIQIYSRDAGKREAKISFNVGQGTQDLGFRSDVDILFSCEPAVAVVLDVRDDDGRPVMGSFIFRDALG